MTLLRSTYCFDFGEWRIYWLKLRFGTGPGLLPLIEGTPLAPQERAAGSVGDLKEKPKNERVGRRSFKRIERLILIYKRVSGPTGLGAVMFVN